MRTAETLRVYSSSPHLERIASADASLPLQRPVTTTSGKIVSEIHVPKGTVIRICLSEMNLSEETWGEDARQWRPERWLEEIPKSVADAKLPGVVPNSMVFWGGNRACLGHKFAILEIKIVLALFVQHLKFTLIPGVNIEWRQGFTILPYVKGEKGGGLPLIVERVDPNSSW